MQCPLWPMRKPNFGRLRPIGIAGCLLATPAVSVCGAGSPAARGPGRTPGTTRHLEPGTERIGVRWDACRLGSDPAPTAPAELYARRIRPLLAKNCCGCHGGSKTSGLDLRTRDGMLRGGLRGPALVPGNPEASRLYRYVASLEKPSMPPGDPLAAGEVTTLKAWIAAGAPAAGGSK